MIDTGNEPDFDFGSAEYRRFFERFGLTPFQHPDWLVPFYRRLPGPAGQTPLVIVGRQAGTGELRFVVPLLLDESGSDRRVTFAFLGVTDYACPVVDPAALPGLSLPAILQAVVGPQRLDISPIHNDHTDLWAALCGVVPEPLSFGSHAVPVASPEGEWRHLHHGAHQLAGLRRKARRLAERGPLRLERVSGETAREAMGRARQFRAGRFSDDPLQVDASAAFYADVAASEDCLVQTFQLVSGDDVAAVMFGLVHQRRFHYLVLACDYAVFARYSPGLLIMDMAIADWIEQGGEVFDFTIGDERFKAAFGCRRTPMHAIRVERS